VTSTSTHLAISAAIQKTKRPLILAVGGGNDSVSTLLLQQQLKADFGFDPESVVIVAVLPDCLDYHDLRPTEYRLVSEITPNSWRSVQGQPLFAFPEKILSTYKDDIKNLPITSVYGISMSEGSIGIARALDEMLSSGRFDAVLAIDVGGDFIAVEENIEVLSPMMDGYMLYALREASQEHTNIPFLYSVFGLGTDGESTPEMLRMALSRIPERVEGAFKPEAVSDVVRLYRDKVEPNRKSRTADHTIKQILGETIENPTPYRGRFHIKVKEGDTRLHYGNFDHYQAPEFFGKFYLFDHLQQVNNPFAFACFNGIEWFLHVQNKATKVNHELNGQSYSDVGAFLNYYALEGKSLFFGTPSRKFDEQAQAMIALECVESIKNGIYDAALMYRPDGSMPADADGVRYAPITEDLMIVARDRITLDALSFCLHQCRRNTGNLLGLGRPDIDFRHS
jgi:hypothetical protein